MLRAYWILCGLAVLTIGVAHCCAGCTSQPRAVVPRHGLPVCTAPNDPRPTRCVP
jgi:hypothetical protein